MTTSMRTTITLTVDFGTKVLQVIFSPGFQKKPMTEKNPTSPSIDFEKYGISRRTLMKAVGTSALAGGMATGSVAAQEEETRDESYDPYPVWEDAETYQVTSSDGVRIHVDETGNPDGQAILFIHGAWQSRLAWDKQMHDGLSDEFRLAAMDLRGHGLSEKPESEDKYTPELWADDIHAVINELNLIDPVLIGWSFGAGLVLDYIHHYGQDQIRGIGLVASASAIEFDYTQYPLPETQDELREFVREMPHQEFSPRDYYYFLGFNLIAVQGTTAVSRAVDRTDLLPEIEVPTLNVVGEEDSEGALETAERVDENVPNSRTFYYPNVGHLPFWEEADRFNCELREFVQEIGQ